MLLKKHGEIGDCGYGKSRAQTARTNRRTLLQCLAQERLEDRVLLTALTLYVTNPAPTGTGSLAAVVAAAPEGSIVDLSRVRGGTAKFNGTVVVPYDVTLTNLGNTPVVLDWTGPGPSIPPGVGSQLALEPQSGATVSNVTITSTWSPWWSANQSGFGIIPAPFSVGVTISQVTFKGLYQGLDLEGGEATCNGNTYLDNTYGAVVGSGSLNESNAVFENNISAGILVGFTGTVTENGGTFINNTGYGVALDKTSSVTLVNCQLPQGDFYNEGGSLVITPPPATVPAATTPLGNLTTITNGSQVITTAPTPKGVVNTITNGSVLIAPTSAQGAQGKHLHQVHHGRSHPTGHLPHHGVRKAIRR